MLIDARTVPENAVVTTDVCIIGGGAAGIILAREFLGKEFKVCLLESGGLQVDEDLKTQSLYDGKNVGRDYFPLDRCRTRVFGGSTNCWTGLCRPLDALDFETRDWIPHSGWPFARAHLVPYYERAQRLCRLGPFAYEGKDWEVPKSHPRLPFRGDRVVTRMLQLSSLVQPNHFGKAFGGVIFKAANITTYTYGNLVDIETTENAGKVTRIRVEPNVSR